MEHKMEEIEVLKNSVTVLKQKYMRGEPFNSSQKHEFDTIFNILKGWEDDKRSENK